MLYRKCKYCNFSMEIVSIALILYLCYEVSMDIVSLLSRKRGYCTYSFDIVSVIFRNPGYCIYSLNIASMLSRIVDIVSMIFRKRRYCIYSLVILYMLSRKCRHRIYSKDMVSIAVILYLCYPGSVDIVSMIFRNRGYCIYAFQEAWIEYL